MKSIDELNAIKNKYKNSISIRGSHNRIRIIVGMGNSGIVAGARDVLNALVEKVAENNLSDKVIVFQEARASIPGKNPVVKIVENGVEEATYIHMTPEKAERIVKEHLIGGKIVDEYLHDEEVSV